MSEASETFPFKPDDSAFKPAGSAEGFAAYTGSHADPIVRSDELTREHYQARDNGHAPTLRAEDALGKATRRLSRAEVLQMRRLAEQGVPWFLERLGVEVTVRQLSFADKTMLAGVEPRIQGELTAAFQDRAKATAEAQPGFENVIVQAALNERIANAVCVAGFIDPPLVFTEADLASKPDAWVVTDIPIDDRIKYRDFAFGQEPEEVRRIATFLHRKVANPAL
jgi:hypothetical protein